MSSSSGTRGEAAKWSKNYSGGRNAAAKFNNYRPNFFVAVQVFDRGVHRNIIQVQEEMMKKDKTMRCNMISSNTFHITLMVMYLKNDKDYDMAKAALAEAHKEWKQLFPNKQSFQVEFDGLGHFGNRVLFAKLKEDQGYFNLCHLQSIVVKNFLRKGIPSTDNRSFTPHLTIAKVKAGAFVKRYETSNKLEPYLYKRHLNDHIGTSTIRSLQLLDMLGPKTSSGYYSGEEFFFRS